MPGSDLNLDLPTLADTFATAVTKLVTAVETIANDLEPRITAGELDLSTELSLGGAPLTNAAGVRLSGGTTSVVGSIYESGGDFFLVTATGLVQLTADGGINVAAAGIIGGDYGGSNPATVTYVDASGEYDFKEEPGVWADIGADDLVLHSATGSLTLSVDNAITTSRAINVKDIPSSGVSALVYKAATSTLESAENTRVTNTFKATAIDAVSLSTSGSIIVGSSGLVLCPREIPLALHNGAEEIWTNSGFAGTQYFGTNLCQDVSGQLISAERSATYDGYTKSSNIGGYWRQLIPVDVGHRITALTCFIRKFAATPNQVVVSLIRVGGGGVYTNLGSVSTSATVVGTEAVTLTVPSPVVAINNDSFFFEMADSPRVHLTLSYPRAFQDA